MNTTSPLLAPRLVTAAAMASVLATSARAQLCEPQWNVDFALPGADNAVWDMALFDDGTGPALFCVGQFHSIGNIDAVGVAKWSGSEWSGLAEGWLINAYEISFYDSGTGADLHIVGDICDPDSSGIHHVARWDGERWHLLDVPLGVQSVFALCTFDDGGGTGLYVTGHFSTLDGETPHNGISKWDGQQWHALGSGLGGALPIGHALAVFDDGTGEELYIGGLFDSAGGTSANNIARWDGKQWANVGSGFDNTVSALATASLHDQTYLYAGGLFDFAGGVQVNEIAEWDGISWTSVGGGVSGNQGADQVWAIEQFNDGSGDALFAAGYFPFAGGVPVNNIAKWDGQSWHALSGDGTNDVVLALASAEGRSNTGPALYVGGYFQSAGGLPVDNIARWLACPCLADFDGNTVVDSLDVLAFLNAFVLGDPSTDVNGDTVVNSIDVLLFLNAFVEGCP